MEAVGGRLNVHVLFWYGIVGLSALILGYFLAASLLAILFLVMWLGWVILLPYHAQLSFRIGIATFSSALILPFLPGRPYFWEFAAILAWTGVIITFSLRRYSAHMAENFRRNRWMYIGMAGYCLVLVVTMMHRGFGLRILGSEQIGGRFYFQQLICAIFPVLFAMLRVDEPVVTRLFILQWFLTGTYLISDFVFSIAPPSLFVLLQFFELPSDALNFEIQVMRFGIRRFQSLAFAGQGFLFLLLIYYNVRSFFSWRAAYLMPLAIGVLGLSLLSGHRWVVAIVGATVLLCAYAQRFYTVRNSIKIAAVLIVSFALLHVGAERMPLAFQRAISFVPGVPIATQAQADAASTVSMRTALIQVGLQLIPVYFWIGRGFARFSDDPFAQWEPTGMTAHVNQGVFYNGFIGLMVNTGLFGTIFMLVFLVATSACAWRIMQHLRQQGCEDNFSRVACIAASLWFANVIGFLLLHGDSEFAMKTFSMQAGLLLVCDSLLRRRLTAAAPAA